MKKLVVCCDGTWMDANDAPDNENTVDPVLQPPTNVTRICRSVARIDEKGNTQIAYYQSGIGTANFFDKIVGGATGMGLAEHIREAYHFLAQNYNQEAGDEICLVGFSRGSFTARSIAAFISAIGLLTPKGMLYFYPIFQDWENQLKPLSKWKPNPRYPWAGPRPNLYSNTDAYTNLLFEKGLTRKNVRIKAVACYDTVGSLGIPKLGVFSSGVMPAEISLDFAFVDTTVPSMVDHAIHALALDESRKPFSPTIWEKPAPGQTLTQVWFQGAHADVGGGYDDLRPSDIVLVWMISQLSPYISFDREVLQLQLHDPTQSRFSSDARSWACGQIHNEFKGIMMTLGGWTNRCPMEYRPYDHATGKEIKDRMLVNTCEKVHSSVRIRMAVPGKGLEDKGDYNPAALEGWKVTGATTTVSPQALSYQQLLDGQKNIIWRKGELAMPEEPLSQFEYELMSQFAPKRDLDFLSLVPKEHKFTAQIRGVGDSVKKWLPEL